MQTEKSKKYYFIREEVSQEIVLLPSQYLMHKMRAKGSPNTIKRSALVISYYLNYLSENQLTMEDVWNMKYEKQQEHFTDFLIYTKERYGETEYVFVKKDDPTKPYQYGMIQAQVMRMIRQKDIRDDNGELLKFGTHIFRHCYGKKLTELHIEDWMIARLLGHKTLQSVHHYRRIGNKVMADETRKTREKMDLILMDIIKGWDGYEL
ncbi:tyrosine-type recombinase/integrase [bacterium TM473]|nr:tyrosine-type recombinase/integrase [bacterium TM473]